MLSSTVYDASRQLLWLEFQSGAVYCYFGVPPQVHQDLISAPSKGTVTPASTPTECPNSSGGLEIRPHGGVDNAALVFGPLTR